MSTLVQVMACCLTKPSHYLNQCWLIISGVKWRSSEANFIWMLRWMAEKSNSRSEFEHCCFKSFPFLPGPNELKGVHWCAILIALWQNMEVPVSIFSGISTCGRTLQETVSHPQCPPLPNSEQISIPIYVIVTNKLLQPLTTTWYDSLVLSFSLLKI